MVFTVPISKRSDKQEKEKTEQEASPEIKIRHIDARKHKEENGNDSPKPLKPLRRLDIKRRQEEQDSLSKKTIIVRTADVKKHHEEMEASKLSDKHRSPEYWKRRLTRIGYETEAPTWVTTREIRVETTFKADKEVVDAVISGVKSMMNDIGLDLESFRFIDCGEDPLTIAEVNQATLQNGRLDAKKLLYIFEWKDEHRDPSKIIDGVRGVPHADILITDKWFEHDFYWGFSGYSEGAVIISVPRARQRHLDFLHNIAKHEAGHLLGFGSHHKILSKEWNVEGYPEVPECLMEVLCPTSVICDECKDALTFFWQGVEKQTGLKFLRDS